MPAKRRRNQTGRRILTGFEEVDFALQLIEKPGVANRVARSALGKGLTVVARAMRSAAPSKSFRRAIGRRNSKPKGKHLHVAKVGLNVNVGRSRWMPHGHLVILGTKPRFRGNKLGITEQAQPGNSRKGIVPGPRGKRGIGGKFYWMETLSPGEQWRRRTGRIKPRTSFIRKAIAGSESATRTAVEEGFRVAMTRELEKVRKDFVVAGI